LVESWHLCDLPTPRAATAAALRVLVEALPPLPAGVGPRRVNEHADPLTALRSALEGADPADRIVVFGSFFTVGGVLRDGVPRLGAAHLGRAD
jgi:dihydrofolate synthase/folylpolyglutamate synthase